MHDKIADLTKKYFQTQNPQVKQQIQTFIDYYKSEVAVAEAKESKELAEKQQNGEIDLDKLINIE